MQKSDPRVDALEEILAHHEKTIEDLSTQLAGQWKIVAELESKVQVLTKRFVTLEENSLPIPENTKPPHY